MTAPYEQQAPIWQGGQPLGSYTSPIPVRPATLGDAVASEWTKIRSVRSTMWTLGVMIVLMVGVGGSRPGPSPSRRALSARTRRCRWASSGRCSARSV